MEQSQAMQQVILSAALAWHLPFINSKDSLALYSVKMFQQPLRLKTTWRYIR